MNVGPGAKLLSLKISTRAGLGAAAHLSERLFQNVLESAKAAASPSRPGKALRAEIETFEVRVGPVTAIACAGPRARAKTLKATETGFPLGIDLAAVERFALVLV